MRTNRIEAFADGVFAIAATLLIIEIHVPEGPLGSGLTHIWPSFIGYVIGFITIGIMWVNHHAILEHIKHCDRTFLFFNVLLLMCIAFVPFPTRLLAEHVRDDNGRQAALVYGLSLMVTAICFNLAWRYAAAGKRLLKDTIDEREAAGISRSYLAGPFMYLIGALIGLANATAGMIAFIVIAMFYVSATIWSRETSKA